MSDNLEDPLKNFCVGESVDVKTLEYYFVDGTYVEFKKYMIDKLGVIRNKKTGKELAYKTYEGYNKVTVYDDTGKRYMLSVHRAIASTFLGAPPSMKHTPDHIDKNRTNSALTNIRWLDSPGQAMNQIRPDTYKSAVVIVKDGVEKTVKEWVAHLAGKPNHMKREYTEKMINHYAIKKQHGFVYKEYPDLEGEEWKPIWGKGWEDVVGSSEKPEDYWEISNMKRVKNVTRYAANILSGVRLRRGMGYPCISIKGKRHFCHILAFRAFHPELWNAKQSDEMVLHKDDDKEDFRPSKLRLGTRSENAKDAHDNGKYNDTKTVRMKCASYVDGVHEKDHDSQTDAAKYIKANGKSKASIYTIRKSIGMMLSDKYENKSAYGRTWEKIE
ncbi:hypothetical protein PBCVCan184_150R [Paramecium bursaria Chlorella virus Can18-4]|nr:hypothetical protein PBCVCan184_150R [Paramecium bursaria Chlorella virus Can18-4]